MILIFVFLQLIQYITNRLRYSGECFWATDYKTAAVTAMILANRSKHFLVSLL